MIETQRRIVEAWRRSLIDSGGSEAEAWLGTLDSELEAKGCRRFGRDAFGSLKRRATLFHIDRCWADHLAWLTDIREGIHLVSLGGRDPAAEFMKSATEVFDGIEERIDQSVVAGLASLIEREGPVDLDSEGLKGPSSTWTYLVNEDQFGWGIELLKGKNIGFTASAAALYGPLYIFTLLVNRLRGKKRSD